MSSAQPRDELMDEYAYAEKAALSSQRVPFYKKKKYWVICAILTVIITIVAVVLALFVIFPAIAQSLMNKSGIEVSKAQIMFKKPVELENAVYSESPVDDMNSTFYMYMESALSNTGPFHANIKFINPIAVHAENGYIGDLYFFTETEIAGGSGVLNAYTPFIIGDNAAFTAFAASMMAVEEFKWNLKGKLEITALSRTATVDLDKEIILKGMNSFPNVKITSFQLPGDAPGGIALELGTMLESPSPISVELGTIALQLGYDGIVIGQAISENVVLQQGENNLLLKGALLPPAANDTQAIEKFGTLFSDYVNGRSSLTTAVGISAAPDGVNPVQWLSDGFKTVKLQVTLPGPAEIPVLIPAIEMKQMEMDFTKDAWNPIASSNRIEATLKNPFGFTLGVTELEMVVDASFQGAVAARLNVPRNPAQTDSNGIITTAFENVPFEAQDKKVFAGFVELLTASDSVTFNLQGDSKALSSSNVGQLPLSGVKFNVDTTLRGLNNFGGSAKVISTKVTGATSDYLIIDLEVELSNPSTLTVHAGDINFNVYIKEDNHFVGRVYMFDTVIPPGTNVYGGKMHLGGSGTNQAVINHMVTGYLSEQFVELVIKGSDESTTIESLQPALKGVQLASAITGIPAQLVRGISAHIGGMDGGMSELLEGRVKVNVELYNPLDTPFTLTKVNAAVTQYARCGPHRGYTISVGKIIDYVLDPPLTVQPKSTATAEQWPVTLDADIDNLLYLMADPEGTYDLVQSVDNTVNGAYEVKDMQYNQNGVTYDMYVEGITEMIDLPGICEMLNVGEPVPPTTASSFSAASVSRMASTNPADKLQALVDKLNALRQGAQPVAAATVPTVASYVPVAPADAYAPVVAPVY